MDDDSIMITKLNVTVKTLHPHTTAHAEGSASLLQRMRGVMYLWKKVTNSDPPTNRGKLIKYKFLKEILYSAYRLYDG